MPKPSSPISHSNGDSTKHSFSSLHEMCPNYMSKKMHIYNKYSLTLKSYIVPIKELNLKHVAKINTKKKNLKTYTRLLIYHREAGEKVETYKKDWMADKTLLPFVLKKFRNNTIPFNLFISFFQ